ncbi:SseB family protein [Rothia sp. ND6WE1A]|uniref:SseB family protein n=1 Tax=Rothia sp. ND6WE1A TaxID=1848190 RepID=UPI000829ADD4|nr:SseB family protein [Rothia sp. ND6WE1A]
MSFPQTTGSASGDSQKQPRELPAHIVAQLASAGRSTDTAGQPWDGRNLGEGTSHTHQYPSDTGRTESAVQQAFVAFVAGDIVEENVVDALRGARVFVPVVAEVSHSVITDEGLISDKEADMALISIEAPDGRKALPIFTSVDALTAWHDKARPVAADMRKTALSAVEDQNQMLVINPGSDMTFVVRRPALWAIAKGESWVPSYKSLKVLKQLKDITSDLVEVTDVRITAGQGVASLSAEGKQLAGGGPGPELNITLVLVPGLNQEQLNTAIQVFQQRLASHRELSEAIDSVQLSLTAQ